MRNERRHTGGGCCSSKIEEQSSPGSTTLMKSTSDSQLTSRRRPRPAEAVGMMRRAATTSGAPSRCYRVHFSCEHTGRYFRSSKRRLSWVVGFAEETDGFGREEHSIELVWSVKSGKTRLVWNGSDVSHLFTQRQRPDMVEFSWMTQSGASLRVVAHAEEFVGTNQYDLFVDGESFFTFPYMTAEVLPSEDSAPERDEKPAAACSDVESRHDVQQDTLSEAAGSDVGDYCAVPAADADFRLSMVGLNTADHSHSEVKDELHSELYSPMLESLRCQISEYLPQLEDMVSRAIINAFFVDPDVSQESFSMSSSSSSLGSATSTATKADPYQVEADALCATYEFVTSNARKSEADRDEDAHLSYMQKQIDSVFVKVRNDVLNPDQATRILLSIGCLLRLNFAKSLSRDTVVFTGLLITATEEDLYRSVAPYGNAAAAAVDTRLRGFGFCRFEDAASAAALEEASQRRQFQVLGRAPACAIILSESFIEDIRETKSRDLEEKWTANDSEGQALYSCYPSSPDSTSIPHLMAPLGSNDYEATFSLLTGMSSPASAGGVGASPKSLKSNPESDRTCSTASTSDSDIEYSHHYKSASMSSPLSVTSILNPRELQGSKSFPEVS